MAAIEHLSYTAPSTRTSQPPEPEMQIIKEQRARGWRRSYVLAENSVTSLYFQSTVKIDKWQIQERNSVKKLDGKSYIFIMYFIHAYKVFLV